MFLRINMTDLSIRTEPVPEKYRFFGGRALTSFLISDEVPPMCDPLGPENVLIFATGVLTGTPVVNTSRISVGGKSPLTGGIKESNVGGTVSAALGRMGIRAVIVEGIPRDGSVHMLRIDESGRAELLPAGEYRGMRTYALARALHERFGSDNGILCIGPAGEERMLSASIQSTDVDNRPCRAAGRGGMGAVMGAKGLKAVVVDLHATARPKVADPVAFREAAKIFAKGITTNYMTSQVFPSVGTSVNLALMNEAGAFPTRNATLGVFEGWEKISGEYLAEVIQERGGKVGHKGCSQCMVRCSNEYVSKDGEYMTSSLEYETIWASGGMCCIDDLDVIARFDYLCDDLGLDTINTGVALSVAMDAGHASFGDGQALLNLVEEVGRQTEIGRLIGDGPVALGRHFNHHRVPAVKNQATSAYDPRGRQGMAVTYATSPMGADHTAGFVPFGPLNHLRPEGQMEASRDAQILQAWYDGLGLCTFARFPILESDEAKANFLKLLNARFGTQYSFADMTELGKSILRAEKDFNRRAGLTSADDRLPKWYYTEALPPHNVTVLISDEEMDRALDF